jgi:hypothetical protein
MWWCKICGQHRRLLGNFFVNWSRKMDLSSVTLWLLFIINLKSNGAWQSITLCKTLLYLSFCSFINHSYCLIYFFIDHSYCLIYFFMNHLYCFIYFFIDHSYCNKYCFIYTKKIGIWFIKNSFFFYLNKIIITIHSISLLVAF